MESTAAGLSGGWFERDCSSITRAGSKGPAQAGPIQPALHLGIGRHIAVVVITNETMPEHGGKNRQHHEKQHQAGQVRAESQGKRAPDGGFPSDSNVNGRRLRAGLSHADRGRMAEAFGFTPGARAIACCRLSLHDSRTGNSPGVARQSSFASPTPLTAGIPIDARAFTPGPIWVSMTVPRPKMSRTKTHS